MSKKTTEVEKQNPQRDEKRELNRSVYSLFHRLVKIAERAENVDDTGTLQWALRQLNAMIAGKLTTTPSTGSLPLIPTKRLPIADDDLEGFVKGTGIGGPPPPKRIAKPEIRPNPISSLIAKEQGRPEPTV